MKSVPLDCLAHLFSGASGLSLVKIVLPQIFNSHDEAILWRSKTSSIKK